MMAWDYMAIPGLTCLAECLFSMSARTDEAHCRQMGGEKFGRVQRLCAAYCDGQLKAESEAWLEIDPDHEFCVDY